VEYGMDFILIKWLCVVLCEMGHETKGNLNRFNKSLKVFPKIVFWPSF